MVRSWKSVCSLVVTAALIAPVSLSAQPQAETIQLERIGRYATGIFAQGAAEISAYSPRFKRLFVVNAANSSIDAISLKDPTNPTFEFAIDLKPYGLQANSVSIRDGRLLAAAVQANVKTDLGSVVFFECASGEFVNKVTVGALPDMLTFTPDGKKVLVANEGEPNDSYTIDPEGSVSIVDVSGNLYQLTQAHVTSAGFGDFSLASLDPSIRIYGPGASVAQDIEPEYITVSHDSRWAWVTLQEANAIGVIDLQQNRFIELHGLGFKDHNSPLNALDTSDRELPGNVGQINIANWPVHGMYQPDGIASFRINGQTYLITANEGDAREYSAFTEEARVSTLTLDPTVFPNASFLKNNTRLGRLTVTKSTGDIGGDGDYDRLHPLGARSFTVWTAEGALVWDSGDALEQITAAASPTFFNTTNDSNNSFDTRSDNKGPEPEGVTVAKIEGRTYAFIGLERIGGVMVYDVSNPAAPQFVQYINPRNFAGDAAAGTADDLGPEGLLFIPPSESPIHKPLLIVSNEISGSVSIYKINLVKK